MGFSMRIDGGAASSTVLIVRRSRRVIPNYSNQSVKPNGVPVVIAPIQFPHKLKQTKLCGRVGIKPMFAGG